MSDKTNEDLTLQNELTEEEQLSDELKTVLDFPPEEDENIIRETELERIKQYKEKTFKNMDIDYSDHVYDADDTSQVRMASTSTVASYLFIKNYKNALNQAAGAPNATDEFKQLAGITNAVFEEVYVKYDIPWKTKDNNTSILNPEKISNLLFNILQKIGSVVLTNPNSK